MSVTQAPQKIKAVSSEEDYVPPTAITKIIISSLLCHNYTIYKNG